MKRRAHSQDPELMRIAGSCLGSGANSLKRCFLSAALVLGATTSLAAQASQDIHEGTSEARRFLDLVRITTSTPGLSGAVAVRGQIVWSDAVGLADLENEVAATPESRFRIGSVSKLFTVAVLARLHETERIDLVAPVRRYVPSFPDKDTEITLLQLAGHLGGIRHYKDADEFLNRKRYESATEALTIFQHDDLLHAPGERYSYSSWGYVLLSAAIEKAAGENFVTVVGNEVLVPLRMESTEVDDSRKIIPHRARHYDFDGDRVVNSAWMDLSDRWASGGYLSTTEDLVRFGSAQLGETWLQTDTKSRLFTSQRTHSGEETGVGVGWRIDKDAWGRTFYHHAGSIAGGRAILAMFPESGVAVALAGNLGRASFGKPEAQTLGDLFISHQMNPGELPWRPDGIWDVTRTTSKGPITGVMMLTTGNERVTGTIIMGDGPEMPIAWTLHQGNRLSVAAVDPKGQLEILWLRGSGDEIEGSSWRTHGDFRASRSE